MFADYATAGCLLLLLNNYLSDYLNHSGESDTQFVFPTSYCMWTLIEARFKLYIDSCCKCYDFDYIIDLLKH